MTKHTVTMIRVYLIKTDHHQYIMEWIKHSGLKNQKKTPYNPYKENVWRFYLTFRIIFDDQKLSHQRVFHQNYQRLLALSHNVCMRIYASSFPDFFSDHDRKIHYVFHHF